MNLDGLSMSLRGHKPEAPANPRGWRLEQYISSLCWSVPNRVRLAPWREASVGANSRRTCAGALRHLDACLAARQPALDGPAAAPQRGRCHRGNSHGAATAPDYGPEQDTVRGAPRIPTANRARCTVARPQRSARAHSLKACRLAQSQRLRPRNSK